MKQLMSNEEKKIHGKSSGMEGYEYNSAVDVKGEKEVEYCEMNNDDDEQLQKFKGLHKREQYQMDEQHQEDSNEDEDGESEDGGNRLDEEYEDEELEQKSQTRDVNPDENYLHVEDDDDNSRFTSTPKGNIKMVKNIQLYLISYFSI